MNPILKYVLLGALTFWLLFKGIIPAWNTIHSDFSNYYVSAKLVVEGKDLTKLYDNDWFQNQIKEHDIDEPGKFAPFPPITAWVMVPLAFTDVVTAKRIWTVFNCFFLVASIWLISNLTNWDWISSALLMLVTGNGLINNFRFGQLYLLVTAAILLSFFLIRKNRNAAGSFMLSIAVWIKYFPVIFIAGFLIEKKHRLVGFTFLSVFVLTIAQTLFFGMQVMVEYVNSSLLPHLDGQLNGQNMYSYLFQSWDSLFRNLFVYSAEFNPHPFIDWPIGRWVFKWGVYVAVVLALVVTLRNLKQSSLENSIKSNLYIAMPALAIFVILPASASYHFILLAVPMMFMLSSGVFSQNEKLILLITYSFIGFIPYGAFFKISNLIGLLFAYPRLWTVSLLFAMSLYFIYVKRALLKNE